MFAIALWDEPTRTLVAARDRAGEKPLYYALAGQGLVLGSEIKALLRAPGVDRDLDLEALEQFLTYEYVITPRTIFRNIRRLPPAHYLVYRDGRAPPPSVLGSCRDRRAPLARGGGGRGDPRARWRERSPRR